MIFNLKKFAAKRIDCILLCCLKWDKLTWVVSKFKTDKFYREVRNVWEVFKIVWNYSKSRKLLATQKVFLHHIFCWYHGGHASTSTSTLKKKMLCDCWDQLNLWYDEVLRRNETTTMALRRTQLMRWADLSRKNVHKTRYKYPLGG